jgi:hypothetical protein
MTTSARSLFGLGARRMLDVLVIEPVVADPAEPSSEPPVPALLVDGRSGLVVEQGILTCLDPSRRHVVRQARQRVEGAG